MGSWEAEEWRPLPFHPPTTNPRVISPPSLFTASAHPGWDRIETADQVLAIGGKESGRARRRTGDSFCFLVFFFISS